MKRLVPWFLALCLLITLLEPRRSERPARASPNFGALLEVGACSMVVGDVNGDGALDISDAVAVLRHLFQGSPEVLVPPCVAATTQVLATGQEYCYDEDPSDPKSIGQDCTGSACLGQDGQYRSGLMVFWRDRVVDNGDGTLTDRVTGLQWLLRTIDVSEDGEVRSEDDLLSWCQALDHCESLVFAGLDDWRLPNVRELHSIVDYGDLETAVVPFFDYLPAAYWSSTTEPVAQHRALSVNFTGGTIRGDVKTERRYVTAVRGGP